MTAPSILFPPGTDREALVRDELPGCLTDLGLDQIISAIISGKDEYNLLPLFYAPLIEPEAVYFRQAVMQDLERPSVSLKLNSFAQRMHNMRNRQAQIDKRYNMNQRMRWFVDTVSQYCDAVLHLNTDLQGADLHAPGFLRIRTYVHDYVFSESFTKLATATSELIGELSAIRYNVLIEGLLVTVTRPEGQPDFGEQIAATFANFAKRSDKHYQFDRDESADVNAVQAKIIEKVVGLYEDTFLKQVGLYDANQAFVDPGIDAFDREIQFYLSYLAYLGPLKKAGLQFSYPRVSDTEKAVHAENCFDMALAAKLNRDKVLPVCNDFVLQQPERMIVVSGPNQGGKTTFARTFGQLHYLAALGCSVASSDANIFLADRIFTHFERAERMTSLRGKLQDDLIRLREILGAATPRSVIVINEIFTSTTLEDALFLSKIVADQILVLDALCVWVTFVEEIASVGKKAVSMVSAVIPGNPEMRTFKIVRKSADGLAYAMSIAKKYRLTRDAIGARIRA